MIKSKIFFFPSCNLWLWCCQVLNIRNENQVHNIQDMRFFMPMIHIVAFELWHHVVWFVPSKVSEEHSVFFLHLCSSTFLSFLTTVPKSNFPFQGLWYVIFSNPRPQLAISIFHYSFPNPRSTRPTTVPTYLTYMLKMEVISSSRPPVSPTKIHGVIIQNTTICIGTQYIHYICRIQRAYSN